MAMALPANNLPRVLLLLLLPLLLLLLLPAPSSAAAPFPTGAFGYLDYSAAIKALQELEALAPQFVQLHDAQAEYNVASPGTCAEGGRAAPCRQVFVRITDEATLDKDRPEVFLSGCLHGNERIGPTTVVEVAKLLVHARLYGTNPWLARLVNTRSIYIMPSANALGYYKDMREENGIDPNRDFPYDTSVNACMQVRRRREESVCGCAGGVCVGVVR